MIASYQGRYRLNIRKGAGTSFPVVRTLERGEKIEIESVDGDWAKCREGYIMADFLYFESEQHTPTGAVGLPENMQDLKVAELRVVANQLGVKLKQNAKKADIIAAIREAQ